MTLRNRLGVLRNEMLRLTSRRILSIDARGPFVSFCFDDCPRTSLAPGGEILKRNAARGTYYVSAGMLDTSNALGEQLRGSDLPLLMRDGHEIGCHTMNHLSSRAVQFRTFEENVLRGQHALLSLTGVSARNFAYPFGHVTVRAKGRIGKHMDSCRGIYGGVNAPTIDLNLLRANSLYGDVSQSQEVDGLLSQTVQSRGWTIFYTHDVCEAPSVFGCTPALLEHAVASAQKQGCCVLPVGEVLASLRN